MAKFQPGQSGNPGGRPKGIGAIAREHTDKAVEILVAALADDSGNVRVAAARELLDRGWGKPLAMTADVSNKLDELNDDELDAGIDALRATLADAPKAGARKAAATKH